MKKIYILFVAGLLAYQVLQGQGTIYVSSLSQNSTADVSVGSDSWLAATFITGQNASGYLLNSVQLGMADASGSPSGFTVMIYNMPAFSGANVPTSSLGTLSGSTDPSTAGIYSYTPASSLILSPLTYYFVVVTAGTTVADGAYEWTESTYPPSINNWGVANYVLHASGTSYWSPTPYLGIAQFAITATPVPEPSPSWLFLLGSGAFLYVRRTFHR